MHITHMGFADNIEDIPGACSIPSCNLLVFFCFAVDLIILDLKVL
jgi:hypothetical protein